VDRVYLNVAYDLQAFVNVNGIVIIICTYPMTN
jgi:hypothetical protein